LKLRAGNTAPELQKCLEEAVQRKVKFALVVTNISDKPIHGNFMKNELYSPKF
jgi:hypothetical protein